MIVYQTDHEGVYLGPVQADESPLEPGVFLIPAGCVEVEPPTSPEGSFARWVNGSWVVEELPPPEPDPEPEPFKPTVISKLQAELAAGEEVVNQIEVIMTDPETPWAMRRAWISANELHRDSQMVDELKWLLNWTDEQVDTLFLAASQIRA